MRILLMLLVLANLGVLAWQQWHVADRDDTPEGRVDEDLGRGLALVGEENRQTTPDAPGEGVEPGESGAGEQLAGDAGPADEAPVEATIVEEADEVACAGLGPFDAAADAEQLRERLVDLGHAAVISEVGGQIRSGFWVYLPPLPSRDAAKEVESELRARNVRDLFIVTASDQRNAISLGLFSTPERADQRAAEIGRLGYTPRVAERFRDATVYWVNFRERPGQPLEPETVGAMSGGETLPEKREIPCSEIAQATGGA